MESSACANWSGTARYVELYWPRHVYLNDVPLENVGFSGRLSYWSPGVLFAVYSGTALVEYKSVFGRVSTRFLNVETRLRITDILELETVNLRDLIENSSWFAANQWLGWRYELTEPFRRYRRCKGYKE